MSQRDRDRRAEEREEQRNIRLSAMAEHARESRQIQIFYAVRTALYPVVEEHNCREMDNICLKCGGLYSEAVKHTRGVYTHRYHNGKIIEQASFYPVEMQGLIDSSDELSVHFKNKIRSYNRAMSFASMNAHIVPPTVRAAYCFRIHGQNCHRSSHLHPHQAREEEFVQLYVLDADLAALQRMDLGENSECNRELMQKIDEIFRRVALCADTYRMMWELEQQVLREERHEASENVTMHISFDILDSSQHRVSYNETK
ncbi:hypothetical protein AVEN_215238-1 [Araneus ventricosus]|uniref:Helitron helicase-like domain-containing protein n=1 Tax=Araneus ventricosus TaxID=182803 RepID=A0A4Y2KUA8_ARAVE|nr:hypothetical protein AVEN_215238-1 [Araneus ventricosus]